MKMMKTGANMSNSINFESPVMGYTGKGSNSVFKKMFINLEKKKEESSNTKRRRVCESTIYREFLEARGENKTELMRRNPTKKEIKDWHWRQENFLEVKRILSFLNENLSRAANRGNKSQKIDVDLDYVYNIGASQDFQCALTGDELEFTRGGFYWLGKWCNPHSCTIDRIDSNKGYIKGNIQLITWRANCLKQHLGNEEFIAFCKDVAYWHK